jgi:hypothetical protein
MKKVAVMLGLVLAMVGGCASQKAVQREHDWQTYEPVGGWENYIPPRRDYEPSAARATAFGLNPQPSLLPLAPSSVAMPTIGH